MSLQRVLKFRKRTVTARERPVLSGRRAAWPSGSASSAPHSFSSTAICQLTPTRCKSGREIWERSFSRSICQRSCPSAKSTVVTRSQRVTCRHTVPSFTSRSDVTSNYDVVFLCGDLNFRINRTRGEVIDIVSHYWGTGSPLSQHDLSVLLAYDQLQQTFQKSRNYFQPTHNAKGKLWAVSQLLRKGVVRDQ